jgi:hypothetical protein
MTEQAQLKVASHLISEDNDYKDVDTYVTEPSGEEWLFRTYLQKEDGEIVKVKPRYAPDKDADFGDDGIKRPPAHVQAAYDAEMPNIRRLIEEGKIEPKNDQVIDSGLDVAFIAAASPALHSDIIFKCGHNELRLAESGLYFRGQLVTDEQEQLQAFRDFIGTIAPATKVPLMVYTQSAGLRPMSEFDAVELYDMVYDEATDGLVPNHNDAEYDPDAVSVFLHCRSGGLECVADFVFDPSEPGTEEAARAAANALAAQLGTMILKDQPRLPYTLVMGRDQLDLIENTLKGAISG